MMFGMFEIHVWVLVCLTFHTNAPEISNLHQYLGEHAGFVRPPPPHIDLCTQMQTCWKRTHKLSYVEDFVRVCA